jgi:glycerol-3-phosphate O-acyltransferase/dihydroxyacetone phosphate acyltransferase
VATHPAPVGKRDHRNPGQLLMTGLARVLVRTFFRQVEVEHAERLDTGRPTVLVADHRNGLVDGLLLMAALGRYPRFLGKSTLFHNPLLWPFLHLAGVVPVHRTQDGGSSDGNAAAFAASDRVLAHQGLLTVFPEGISHDQPGLQPLRTGAARIALAAADHGVVDLDTVAVALVYDDKQRFRSRALVRVGRPQPVDGWLPRWRSDPRGTVRDLTDDLADRLRRAGPELDEWEDAAELVAVADITARTLTVLPADSALVDRQRVLEGLAAADHGGRRVAAMESLRFAYREYRRDLDLCGLTDAQVAASYRSGDLRAQYLRALAKVALAAPLAAVGAAVHLVPYELVKMGARIPANQSVRATVKLIGSFFLYLATYAGLGVLVSRALGPLPGLLAAVGAPACGYVTLRMAERVHRMGGARQGLRLARVERQLLDSVVAHRTSVVEAARSLLDGDGRPTASPAAPALPRVGGG